MIRTILDTLTIIINPLHWISNDSYDSQWNEDLNYLLANNNFTDIGECTAKLGNNLIWIANHPYASFQSYGYNISKESGRPSKLTIIRAKRKLDKDRKDAKNVYVNTYLSNEDKIQKLRDEKLSQLGI